MQSRKTFIRGFREFDDSMIPPQNLWVDCRFLVLSHQQPTGLGGKRGD
jgi:hypothetical protein